MSTMSQVTLPDSTWALSLASPSAALSVINDADVRISRHIGIVIGLLLARRIGAAHDTIVRSTAWALPAANATPAATTVVLNNHLIFLSPLSFAGQAGGFSSLAAATPTRLDLL